MTILGIGIDIVENARIESSLARFGDSFVRRVFTGDEIAYCAPMKFPARHYAARFAAKEAVSKAFGTGIGETMGWLDIEVRRSAGGAPVCVLHGGAAKLAAKLGGVNVLISLTHTDTSAAASVVLVSPAQDRLQV